MTGASGFVGRHIASELQRRGASIRATHRGGRPLPEGISDVVRTTDLFSEGKAFWDSALVDIDIVIHAAWYVDHVDYVHSSQNLHAMSGSLVLAQAAIRSGIRRFVGIGTCLEYDLSSPMPLSRDSPIAPSSLYGVTKAGLYLAMSQAFAKADISFAWARLFYLYGDGEDPRRFMAHIRAKLNAGEPAEMTSGNQIRDYLEVCDAAKLIVELALGVTQGAANICSGKRQSLADLALSLAQPMNCTQLLRIGALPDRVGEPFEISGLPFSSICGETI